MLKADEASQMGEDADKEAVACHAHALRCQDYGCGSHLHPQGQQAVNDVPS